MRVYLLALLASLTASVSAFSPVIQPKAAAFSVLGSQTRTVDAATRLFALEDTKNDDSIIDDATTGNHAVVDLDWIKAAYSTVGMWTLSSTAVFADSPDWGLFEGRTGSLLHPIVMVSMLLLSLSTGLLGWQWRRQRELGTEISALKKTLPKLGSAKTVQEALEVAQSDDGDASQVAVLQAALSTESEIASKTQERKELSSKNLRDKHYNQGALLAFLGTAFAIEGPLNTYARAGKLFPGPHLYAGAGIVVLWAAAAACVPAMSKGNDTARSLHIAANTVGVGLFAWQVTSGIPILLKVIEKTTWP